MQCANHSDRAAVGICVSCRKLVCPACTTRLQGRNFCLGCLEQRAAVGPDRDALRSGPGARLATGLLTVVSGAALVGAFTSVGFFLYLLG